MLIVVTGPIWRKKKKKANKRTMSSVLILNRELVLLSFEIKSDLSTPCRLALFGVGERLGRGGAGRAHGLLREIGALRGRGIAHAQSANAVHVVLMRMRNQRMPGALRPNAHAQSDACRRAGRELCGRRHFVSLTGCGGLGAFRFSPSLCSSWCLLAPLSLMRPKCCCPSAGRSGCLSRWRPRGAVTPGEGGSKQC